MTPGSHTQVAILAKEAEIMGHILAQQMDEPAAKDYLRALVYTGAHDEDWVQVAAGSRLLAEGVFNQP